MHIKTLHLLSREGKEGHVTAGVNKDGMSFNRVREKLKQKEKKKEIRREQGGRKPHKQADESKWRQHNPTFIPSAHPRLNVCTPGFGVRTRCGCTNLIFQRHPQQPLFLMKHTKGGLTLFQ